MNHPLLPWIAAGIFAMAVLHTFSTKYLEHLAHTHPRHAGIWHLLGEVEVVFGLWALVLALTLFGLTGKASTLEYLESRNFTEPLFVFAIMVVAATWQWDLPFMLQTFGWKSAVAVLVNATMVTLLMRRELLSLDEPNTKRMTVPSIMVAIHLSFLLCIVLFAHHPVVFMGLLLFFIGYTSAYAEHQDRLILREALLVAFFLAGLVELGGQQSWWLNPLLMGLNADAVFYGAAALTSITDNAALTYLASQVPNLSDEFKVAIVAGAVSGGGLTVIANAPNPAGMAILKGQFEEGVVNPGKLLLAALPPTAIAAIALKIL